MSNSKEENILGTEKIGHLLKVFAVPGIVSMVVNSIYNIVDQVFIGQGVGYLGNGATNVIFPMTTLALAFSLMAGNGAGSYMSLMLGRKNEKEAARGTAAGMVACVGIGLALAVIYLIFMEPLCRLFGCTDSILPYALVYGRIIAIGIPFSCIDAGFSSMIRSDGSPKYNMAGLLLGCVLNIILDPIFIFICGWGVAGAAWATIIGQIANAIMIAVYIPRFKTIKLDKKIFASCMPSMKPVLNLGISSFISQFVVVIAIAVQNNVMVLYGASSKYGSDIPMTALGVTMKVFNILMAIVIGLASGAQPIWGYNYGAGKYERVKETFKRVMTISIAVMCVAWVIFRICPVQIVSIFGTDSELYTEFSVKCLQIFLLAIPLGAVQMVSGVYFQSVGFPMQSSVVSLSKQILFQLPFSLILPMFIGVEGVLWAGALSDTLACVMCLILYKIYWPKMFDYSNVKEPEVDRTKFDGVGYLGDGQFAGEHAPNVIITLGRTYGSAGLLVGKKLAEELELPFYDGEIMERAAEESGLSKKYLTHVNENVRSYRLVYSLVPLRNPSVIGMEELRNAADLAQNEIIMRAAQGPCIIVGRRADQLLADRPNVLRVFITEDLPKRVQFIVDNLHLSEAEARKKVEEIDEHRANYYGDLNGKVWGHADNYDLTLNIGTLGMDTCCDLIKRAIADRGLM